MDFNCLVLSHGRMCEAAVDSLKMIMNEADGIYALPLLPDTPPNVYVQQVNDLIESFNGKPFIVITDVFGGTPYNTGLRLLQNYDTFLLSGLCLGMLMEIPFLKSKDSLEDIAKALAEISHKSCRVLNREAFMNHKETLF